MIPTRTARLSRLAPLAALALLACSDRTAPAGAADAQQRLLPPQAAQTSNAQAAPTPGPNLCKGKQSPLPAPAGFVSDFAKVIDARTKRNSNPNSRV